MNCFPIFTTESLYFCYSMTNNKIYVGKQKPFKPNLLFFLGIYLVPLISKKIDGLLASLQNRIDIYIVTAVFGILGSVLLGIYIYKKVMKSLVKELEEIYLTDEQIREYILRGKQQFYLLVIVGGVLLSFALIFMVLSCCWKSIVYIVLEVICSFAVTLMILWIRPSDRLNLIKTVEMGL